MFRGLIESQIKDSGPLLPADPTGSVQDQKTKCFPLPASVEASRLEVRCLFLYQPHVVLQGDGQVISHLTDLKISGVGLVGMGWNIAKGKIVFQFTEGVFLATTTRNKGEQLLSLPLFRIRHDRGVLIETIIGREKV